MDGFTGNAADFAQAHGKVNNVKSAMDANLASLRSAIEETQAGWSGSAAGVFQQVMQAFDEKTKKLNQALEDIGDLLQQSGHKYDAQEQEAHQQVSQLGSVLDGL